MLFFFHYYRDYTGAEYDAWVERRQRLREKNYLEDEQKLKDYIIDVEEVGSMGQRKWRGARDRLTYRGRRSWRKYEPGYDFWEPENVKSFKSAVKLQREADDKSMGRFARAKRKLLYQYRRRATRLYRRQISRCLRFTKTKRLNIFLSAGNKKYLRTKKYLPARPLYTEDPVYALLISRRFFTNFIDHYLEYKDFYRWLRKWIKENTSDFIFLCCCSFFVFLFFFVILPFIFFFSNILLFKFPLFFLNFFLGLFEMISFMYFLLINILIPFLSPFVIVQLVPEFILLCGILIILLLRSRFYQICDLSFIRKLLRVSFKEGLTSIENDKSFEARLVGSWLPSFREVYVANLAWNIFFISVFISEVWMLFSSADYVCSCNGRIDSIKSLSLVDERFLYGGINDVFFGNHFLYDSYTYYSRFLILTTALAFLVIFKNELELDPSMRKIEYVALIMCGLLFSIAMPSASSLLSLFLIAEGLVMVMYILSSGSSGRYPSGEGSLKYAILNSISTVMFILGSIFILCVEDIYFLNLLNNDKIIIGLVLISLTFLFKIGAFPFQNWMADLYESTSLGVLAFFLLIPKLSIILTLINLSRLFFVKFSIFFFVFFLILGLLSFIVGSVLASSQTKISRLLAYSSISQTGALLILLSFVILNPYFPVSLLFLFTIVYALVSIQTMSMMSNLRRGTLSDSLLAQIKDISFIKFAPRIIQTIFSTFIFNLSGLPPFIGWILKSIIVFSALLLLFCDINLFLVFDAYNLLIWLSVLIFILSLISVYYSIRIYKLSYELQPIDSFFPMITRDTSILNLSTLFMFCFVNFFGVFIMGYVFSWIFFVVFY